MRRVWLHRYGWIWLAKVEVGMQAQIRYPNGYLPRQATNRNFEGLQIAGPVNLDR